MSSLTALRTRDALDQLCLEHRRIRKLLRQYRGVCLLEGCGRERKAEIVERLCDALSLNALIEEEVLYPMVRPMLDGAVLVQTALCDHARLRELIARLDEMEPGDPGYDEAVMDIGDCVLPSLDGAQAVLFVHVRMTGLDTSALGEQMARHRRAQRQDFTRIGLSRSSATGVAGGWPPACPLSLA